MRHVPKVLYILFVMLCVQSSGIILSVTDGYAQGASYVSAADYLFKVGKGYYRQQRYRDAIHELRKVLVLNPDHSEAQDYLDRAYEADQAPFSTQERVLVDDVLPVTYEQSRVVSSQEQIVIRDADVVLSQTLPGERQQALEAAFDAVEGKVQRTIPAASPAADQQPKSSPEPEPDRPPRYKAIQNTLDRFLATPERIAQKMKETLPDTIRMTGEYQMAIGIAGSDSEVAWKDAEGNNTETDSRFLFSDANVNSYDRRVFNRFRTDVDYDHSEAFSMHTNITVDPWTFIGKSDKITIQDSLWGNDSADIELKYWSNTGKTKGETVYTLENGDSFILPEIKVVDGKTVPTTVTTTFGNTFMIPETEIERKYFPVRELWFDYKKDNYSLRVFPIGYEDQALTSDDPLGLSNHHIYWEPSPWVYEWQPGHINTNAAPNDFFSGRWSDALIYSTRDSDLLRLNSLRGVAFSGEIIDGLTVDSTVAAAKTLWQDYDSVSSVPSALRLKYAPSDKWDLGSVVTFVSGWDDGSVDATNTVIGLDGSYRLTPEITVRGEAALSQTVKNKTSPTYEMTNEGDSYHLDLATDHVLSGGEGARLKTKTSVTHMDSAFDAGLANYHNTRRDQFWSRHIYFKNPLEFSGLSYYDIEPFRLGDGIDYGRNAYSFRAEVDKLLDGDLDLFFDTRYVASTEGDYIETVFRNETTYRINDQLTSKLLLLYHDLPDTTAGIDPFVYDSTTGAFIANAAIEEGKDPSLGTVSTGLEYEVNTWFTLVGIYELTNDTHLATDNFPQGLLTWSNFATSTVDNEVYRDTTSGLYSQDYFDLPPYDYFNIFKCKAYLYPLKDLTIELSYTHNDFKYAGPIDNNMNHVSIGAAYRFTDRLSGLCRYTYSHWRDLYDQVNLSEDPAFNSHHNVSAQLNYAVGDSGHFIMQYGEGALTEALVGGATNTPFGDSLPVLDTRHIVRMFYKGKF